jgi:hypothetical protein
MALMKIVTTSEEVFACYSRACAPPPVGTGGSGGGGRGGGRGIDREAARRLTNKYGSRHASGGAGRGARKAAKAEKTAGQKAGERWEKGSGSKSVADPRTGTAVARLTAKYGGRKTSTGRKNTANVPEDIRTSDRVMKLTNKYGSRRRGS